MNDILSPTPAPRASENAAEALAALQKQVHNIVIILIVAVAVLDIFMLRQWVITRKDLNGIEPQFTQMQADFNRVKPTMESFLKQLSDYARTHPDFQAVLAKYPFQAGPAPVAAAPANAKPAKPAPPAPTKAAATAPKK